MDNLKTLITHNKGGDWSRLNAPETDSNGNSYKCGKYCYLHLYSYSSKLPRFYTVDNAIGIIIGNGCVGHYMDMKYSNVALFLSRDGGITWFEIRKGIHIYEIGDSGGLIVIAKYDTPTKYVHYTYDEGITWTELKVSDEDIYIKNILNDDTSSKQKFILYGLKKVKGEVQGLSIALDFSTLRVRVCGSSDYETWKPKSSTSKDITNNCVLGKEVTYMRRKRESSCVNGEGYQMKLSTKICECTEDDYQCDLGYHRDEPGEPCTPIKKATAEQIPQAPENCVGYYNVTRGYRKIPGTVCSGLNKYEPLKVACPYNRVLYGAKILFYLFILITVLSLIYYIKSNTNIEMSDIIEGIISLKPNITLSSGENRPQTYLTVDNTTEDEGGMFGFDPVIQSKSEKKKSKKNTKKSSDGSGVLNNPDGESSNLVQI